MDRKTIVMVATLGFAGASLAQQGVFQTKSLTPETALSAAKAAMEFCRKQGYQVAVAVADRAGLAQVVLRDRFAGAHTLDVASNKAWTAASFRTPTTALAAETHAGNFLFNRTKQIQFLQAAFRDGPPPIVISPYDAELYGHWWYEGPIFLDYLIRKAAREQDVLRLQSPIDYLREYPEQQLAQPPMSSWGAGGYAAVWLDEGNDWIYRYVHKASERMIELARIYQDASGVIRRALNQAARELLLAQSSDWAFIIKTGTMVDYAVRRTREHLLRFSKLYDQLKSGGVDEMWLASVEGRDNLFPEIDYRVYRPA